jgi:hypothetical protein
MSQDNRKLILDAAIKNAELLSSIPPILAAGFGVVPIARAGQTLTIACFAHVKRPSLEALRKVLGLELVASPFEDQLLHRAISQAYFPNDESLNFPTFLEPDFLERDSCLEQLRTEKVEKVGPPAVRLPPSELVLSTLTYSTTLESLDQDAPSGLRDPRRTKFELRDDPVAWLRDGRGCPIVHSDEAQVREGPLAGLLVEYRFSDHLHIAPGALYAEHVLRSTPLLREGLPFVIHPSEIQLERIEADGSLVFHAYDHEEIAKAGRASWFELTYYFLSYGSRLRREIRIAVHEVEVVDRQKLEVRPGPAPWGKTEFGRWLQI